MRVDHTAQTLEAVVPSRRKRDEADSHRNGESECSLDSVHNLRMRIQQERHVGASLLTSTH